jgi:hypothetical protein
MAYKTKCKEIHCCGIKIIRDIEAEEKIDETEELEREIFDMLQKIKSHNKKKIYDTTKDLYKLFKRDKKL